MRTRVLSFISSGIAALFALSVVAHPAPAPSHVKLDKAIRAPGNPLRFDISWVDQKSARYYLGEAGNAGVDVFDVRTDSFLGRIGGFHGLPAPSDPCGRIEGMGPSGVVVTPGERLWATDAHGTVKEFDVAGTHPAFDKLKPMATLSTGATCRSDEIGYDPKDRVIMAGNPGEAELKPYKPPFASFISAGSPAAVIGKITFSTADGFAFNATGLEQPLWDAQLDRFLVPVQGETEGLLAVIKVDKSAKKFTIEKTFRTPDCNGSGLALGRSQKLLVGCDDGHPLLIMDPASGKVEKTLPQVHGSDEVWYNPGDDRFYAASAGPNPALGVIDATTGEFVENAPTGPGAHSVSAYAKTNQVFVPIGAPNPRVKTNACVTLGLPAGNGCIAIYGPAK